MFWFFGTSARPAPDSISRGSSLASPSCCRCCSSGDSKATGSWESRRDMLLIVGRAVRVVSGLVGDRCRGDDLAIPHYWQSRTVFEGTRNDALTQMGARGKLGFRGESPVLGGGESLKIVQWGRNGEGPKDVDDIRKRADEQKRRKVCPSMSEEKEKRRRRGDVVWMV
jgi:hypothetical protein